MRVGTRTTAGLLMNYGDGYLGPARTRMIDLEKCTWIRVKWDSMKVNSTSKSRIFIFSGPSKYTIMTKNISQKYSSYRPFTFGKSASTLHSRFSVDIIIVIIISKSNFQIGQKP